MITQITYARLWNLGNYENERFEATATVGEGEDPAVVLREVKAFVENERLRMIREYQAARQKAAGDPPF